VQEGDLGFDTEQTIGGERVPYVDFGFVAPKALTGTATGSIVGTADKSGCSAQSNGTW